MSGKECGSGTTCTGGRLTAAMLTVTVNILDYYVPKPYIYNFFKDLLKFILRELKEDLSGEKNLQNNGAVLVGLGYSNQTISILCCLQST